MIAAISIGFLEIELVDIIDVMVVTIVLTQVYKLMKGSIAIRVFIGFLFLYMIYFFVNALNMELMSTILGQFVGVGVLALIILFQQEIRKFLIMLGRTTLLNEGDFFKTAFSFWTGNGQVHANILPIIEASKTMAASNTGALIVVSKNTELKFYAESGDRMDALISKRLIMSIFNKYGPLHDGAIIIHGNRIIAARCVLPVSERENLPANFGLRHRAAVGMSESTDVFIIIVSEETGQISIARNGQVRENITIVDLRQSLHKYLSEQDKGEDKKPEPEQPKEESVEVA